MDCAIHIPTLAIAAETRFDVVARERLLDAAFGTERHEKTSERLREDRLPAEGLAFTLKADGKLVGTIRLWNISAGGTPALLLGPLAIAESHEGMGPWLQADALCPGRGNPSRPQGRAAGRRCAVLQPFRF